MKQGSKEKIESIIEQGYDFKFGDYLGRGFEITQKYFGGFIAFTLLYILITFVISLIPFIGQIASSLFISPALTVGLFLVAHKIWRRQTYEFGDFFKGFDYVGQLAIASVVTNLILVASVLPFGFVVAESGFVEWFMDAMQDPIAVQGTIPPMPPGWTWLLLLPCLFLAVSYSWTFLFIAFYKMEFWEAMESSRRLIAKQWPIIVLFSLVQGIIVIIGVFVLCIGVLFTLPAAYCMTYAAFEDVTKLNAEEPDDLKIEQHLIV